MERQIDSRVAQPPPAVLLGEHLEQNSQNFLKDRIRQQAQVEGVPLTSDEEMYLELASGGRMAEANQALRKLKENESIQHFGQKLATLLSNAYQQDLKSDPNAKVRYMEAMQSLTGGHSIFRLVLPLILGRGIDTDMSTGAPVSIPGNLPPTAPDFQGNIPEVRPESSFKRFMLLLILVIAGLVIWLMISRTR